MTLEPDWKQAWKWFSVHAMALALALQGAWMAVPGDLRADVPTWTGNALTAMLMVAGLVGRLTDQKRERA